MMRFRLALAGLALGIPAAAVAADTILIIATRLRLLQRVGWPPEGTVRSSRADRRRRQAACVDESARRSGDLASCHTAIIDGMMFDGDVPIADIERTLAQRPRGVSGRVVVGMPLDLPGMDVPGRAAQPYAVVAFG